MDTVEKIIKLLEEQNIKPSKMMKDLGFSSGLFSQWKSKKQNPSSEKVSKIADYLNVSADYLLGNTDDAPLPPNAYPADVSSFVSLPVYGEVSAGYGALADDSIIGYETVDTTSMQHGEEYFFLRVVGDSMQPMILDGDLALVRKQKSVDSGSLAVVVVDNEVGVIKRVNYGADWIELVSFNPYYPPRRFEGAEVQRVFVIGLVKELKRKL